MIRPSETHICESFNLPQQGWNLKFLLQLIVKGMVKYSMESTKIRGDIGSS